MLTIKSKLDRFCWFVVQKRLAILIAILVVTVIAGYGATRMRTDVVVKDMFPYDHPYLKLNERVAKVFGGSGSGVVMSVKVNKGDIFNEKTLTKIKQMTEEVELWDEVYRLLTSSLASQTTKTVKTRGKGEIEVSSLMYPEVPKTQEEIDRLKKNIYSNDAYAGTLVSEDGTSASILTVMQDDIPYLQLFKKLQALKKKYEDENTSIHIVGFPVLMGWIYNSESHMYLVFGISILAIILALFLIFKNFQGMFSPVVNAVILTVWGLGFIGFTGINFNPLLYVLVFLVGARMIGNSNQIACRYFEELDSSGGDRVRACYETMRTMWIPNFAAVVGDAAGFAVLFIAKIVLMQHLAIIMTFWMSTILMTGFLVPVVCSFFTLKVDTSQWKKETCMMDKKAKILMKITDFSISPRGRYVVGAAIVLLTIGCVWQMGKLKIGDPVPGSPIFYKDHRYNRDQAVINKDFKASSESLELFYEGERESVYDPAVMQTFEGFTYHMAEKLPDIYKTSNSIIDLGKMVNLTLHDGDQVFYKLPWNEQQLSGLLGYMANTAGTAQLRRYFDPPMERSRVTLFFADHTSDNLLRIRDTAYAYFKDHPMKTEKGHFELAGGRIGMEIGVNEEMMRTHLYIDLAIYVGIFLLCACCYRSVVAGLMLTIPLMLANAMSFSYMSLKNIGLSINTLPVAAIGAGVGVDFAIYLYSRCMEEYHLMRGDWKATIVQSICTCGKAIVYTGITIILPILTWYFFSDMKFQAEVGFFLSLIMGVNVLLSLTLHPLLIWIIKPKFISRKQGKAAQPEGGES